jgi:hypothetical protein
MKPLAIPVAVSLALFASSAAYAQQDLASTEFFLGENGALQFTVMDNGAARSCNEVSFAAIPGDTAHVIGRYNNGCASTSFSLARYAIDWNAQTLTLVNLAFDTGGGSVAVSKGDSISTAYDATVMSYSGELWVAFECGGTIAGATTASSCVGPMDASTGVLDASRTNVVVLGNSSLGDGYYYSASVPELLDYGGTPYLYWSAVKMGATAPNTWVNITGRGMKLEEVPASGGELWNANTGTWVGSADPNNTIEVWGLGSSTADDAVADLQGVFTNGTDIFVTAGVAGTGCAQPFWPPTCYAFTVSKTTNPFATDTFSNGTQLSASELPSNTHSYSRFIQDPNGRGYILGGYYTNAPGARPLPISGGPNAAYVTAYPIPSRSSYFPTLGGALALSTGGTTMVNADGRLEVFAVGTDHSLAHSWQSTPGGSFSGWAAVATADPMISPTVQRNADGRLEAFAVGTDQAIWHTWQTAAGGAWNGAWASLGEAANSGPVVEINTDGTLDAFVVGTDGAVYHDRQGGSSGWLGWVSLGGSAVGSPAVQRNADGRLEAFAIDTSGALSHAWQATPGGTWSGWASLGGTIATPVVQRNADGRLEAFGVGAGGALYHTWQTTPGGAWNGVWASLGGVVTSPTVARSSNGTLQAFAVGDDLAIYTASQTIPGGAWGAWTSLGGNAHGAAVQTNADGTLELFAVAFDGAVSTSLQTASGWSGWTSLDGNALPFAFAASDDDAPLAVTGGDAGAQDASAGAGDGGGPGMGDSEGGVAGAADGGGMGRDGGSRAAASGSSGCGCGVTPGAVNPAPLLLLLVGVAARGRARRRGFPSPAPWAPHPAENGTESVPRCLRHIG